jgi:hypothetical protein
MKRIKVRDHDVHFEHHLIAAEPEIGIARKDWAAAIRPKVVVQIAPIDVAIFERNALALLISLKLYNFRCPWRMAPASSWIFRTDR